MLLISLVSMPAAAYVMAGLSDQSNLIFFHLSELIFRVASVYVAGRGVYWGTEPRTHSYIRQMLLPLSYIPSPEALSFYQKHQKQTVWVFFKKLACFECLVLY